MQATGQTRRDFARRFALGGSAALPAAPSFGWTKPALLEPSPRAPGEAYWAQVRSQFLMPPGIAVLNAANLCPSSDFYSGSAHKWPCGPKEAGVLFVHRRVQAKFWPSVISAYPGATGLSKTHEGLGQRDEPALLAFGESLKLQQKIGMTNIERRGHELASALIDGLTRIDGVKLWTTGNPQLRTSVVSLQPGTLDPHKLTQALFERDGIICATRAGADRGGIRFSPHLYNSHAEVERVVAAIRRFMTSGV